MCLTPGLILALWQVHKRHSLNPSSLHEDRETEEIRPRTLDMSDADPLNGLSLSPMNMSSASPFEPMAASSAKFARQSMRPPGQDERRKRMRLGLIDHPIEGLTLDEQLIEEEATGAGPSGLHVASTRSSNSGRSSGSVNESFSESFGQAPSLRQKHNSLYDTKMLFARKVRNHSTIKSVCARLSRVEAP